MIQRIGKKRICLIDTRFAPMDLSIQEFGHTVGQRLA
jgi:hypothetical protein